MGSPFTITSVSNYNSNPPPDDGSQIASNRVQWSTQKTKLSDPIFNAFNTSQTATLAAFGKIFGGAAFTTTALPYTVSSSDQGKIVKASASGITITTPDATVVGSPFLFGILNNSSSDITLDGNGTQTIDGQLTVDIPAGNGLICNTDGSNWFTCGQNFASNIAQPPQGYLTLTSNTPVITGDVIAATSVFYTPFIGSLVPISTDGATFRMRSVSQLTLTLAANHLASTIYDVFLFDNPSSPGTTQIGTGPAWATSTAGSGSRGTGAGTTQLQRINGVWTNANSMTARNGATTFTVPVNEGTYVGSIYIDATAGQVTCHRSYGQNRKFGVWNAYNRVPIILVGGDPTSSWNYGVSQVRASNGAPASFSSTACNVGSGTVCNSLTVFNGLPEEEVATSITQLLLTTSASAGIWKVGIGFNSTTAFSGTFPGVQNIASTNGFTFVQNGAFDVAPALGINVILSLENAPLGVVATFDGQQPSMLLRAQWRG